MPMIIVLPRRIAERLRREAEKLGVSLEEIVVEALSEGLDPKDRACDYIEAAMALLEQARGELARNDVRQAAEKAWGAAALAVKAYAWWRNGRRISSHGELWEQMRQMAKELGDWVREAWMFATSMHVCFYEGWCTQEDVEAALERIEKLVKEVKAIIEKG